MCVEVLFQAGTTSYISYRIIRIKQVCTQAWQALYSPLRSFAVQIAPPGLCCDSDDESLMILSFGQNADSLFP